MSPRPVEAQDVDGVAIEFLEDPSLRRAERLAVALLEVRAQTTRPVFDAQVDVRPLWLAGSVGHGSTLYWGAPSRLGCRCRPLRRSELLRRSGYSSSG